LYLPPLWKLLKYINHLGCFQDLLLKSFQYASLGSIFFACQKLKLPASFIALKWIELAYKTAYAHARVQFFYLNLVKVVCPDHDSKKKFNPS